MMQVKIFTPDNKLAKALVPDGGTSFDDLVIASEGRINTLSDGIQAYVAEQLALILRICEDGEEAMFGHARELADAAMKIAEVAGAARRSEVGEVARGIRAMLDALIAEGIWHSDALQLHVAVLAMFNRDTALSEDEVTQLLGSMIKIRRSIGVED